MYSNFHAAKAHLIKTTLKHSHCNFTLDSEICEAHTNLTIRISHGLFPEQIPMHGSVKQKRCSFKIFTFQFIVYSRDVKVILHRGPHAAHFDLKCVKRVRLHERCVKLQKRLW